MATKKDRPTRKLRKERKNRAKKVSLTPPHVPKVVSLTSRFTVPWYQEGQGCRATKEGQIEAGRFLLSLSCISQYSLSVRNIIILCILLRMRIVQEIHVCVRICKASIIRGYTIYTIRQKSQKASKSQTFCGSRLDPPGIPPPIPTSRGGFSEDPPQSQRSRTFVKAFRPARIEPPIHVEYLRSGGA